MAAILKFKTAAKANNVVQKNSVNESCSVTNMSIATMFNGSHHLQVEIHYKTYLRMTAMLKFKMAAKVNTTV